MSSHQGDLKVPAGGGDMGKGYCRNWGNPQGKSGNLGEIRSMCFRWLLLPGLQSCSPAGWRSPQASGPDPEALSKSSCSPPFTPALEFLNSLTLKWPESRWEEPPTYVEWVLKVYRKLRVVIWSQV